MTVNSDPIFDKVLFIGPQIKGAFGGIETVLQTYNRNIDKFHYLQTNSSHGFLAGLLYLASTVVLMPVHRLAGRRIVHIHHACGKSWIRKKLLFRWARLLGYRTVMHCHGGAFRMQVEKDGVENVRRLLSKADAVIVLSKEWKDYFEDYLGLENVLILNNPIERVIPPVDMDVKYSRDVTPRFVFLGKLGKDKGVYDMLEAVRLLKNDGITVDVAVGGNGETDVFQQRVIELGLNDCVHFLGWVSGEQKDRLLREREVLLLPSYFEGLPICILESMAYRQTVISTPVGGIPSIIESGKNGTLVSPGDAHALADAIRQYFDNPELARRHAEASSNIIENFYVDKVMGRLAGIFNKLECGKGNKNQ